jgi:hypothetical protein
MWGRCRSYFTGSGSLDDTSNLTPLEIARLAADLGFQPGDLSVLNSSSVNFDSILNLRLQQFDISAESISNSVLQQMQLQCIRCVRKGVCQREVKKGSDVVWPTDCPNLEILQKLILRRKRSSAYQTYSIR